MGLNWCSVIISCVLTYHTFHRYQRNISGTPATELFLDMRDCWYFNFKFWIGGMLCFVAKAYHSSKYCILYFQTKKGLSLARGRPTNVQDEIRRRKKREKGVREIDAFLNLTKINKSEKQIKIFTNEHLIFQYHYSFN